MTSLPRFLSLVKPQNMLSLVLIAIVVGLLNIAALYASSQATTIQGQQTMKRESLEGEILEGRSIIVNVPRLRGGNETMVVMV